MTLLAVMALSLVTPGAVSGVPISGQYGVRVLGQVTSAVHVSRGAARSEPHGQSSGTAAASSTAMMVGECRVVRVVYPGCRVCQGRLGTRAEHRCRRVHIRTVP